jgi:hypothetical protein
MNAYIYNKIQILSNEPMDFKNKNYELAGLKDLPDGAIYVNEVNKKRLSYKV